MRLRLGDTGSAVKRLQQLLADKGFDPKGIDGWFGEDTEKAVKAFQAANNLEADGIVGTETQRALGIELEPAAGEATHHWDSVPADRYKDGYANFNLREDVAEAYMSIYREVKEAGGIIPSSGGKRALSASVGAGRSKTSFHYTGRALDVMIHSAMSDPRTDPLVIVQETSDTNPYWRVFVKAADAPQVTLDGVVWKRNNIGSRRISGNFLDLTELFAQAGFDRIRARSNWRRSYINSEWWHFQYITGLVVGESTFGDELLKVYDRNELERYPPWDFRHYVFKGKGFGRP
jgi:hypothetical protein